MIVLNHRQNVVLEARALPPHRTGHEPVLLRRMMGGSWWLSGGGSARSAYRIANLVKVRAQTSQRSFRIQVSDHPLIERLVRID